MRGIQREWYGDNLRGFQSYDKDVQRLEVICWGFIQLFLGLVGFVCFVVIVCFSILFRKFFFWGSYQFYILIFMIILYVWKVFFFCEIVFRDVRLCVRLFGIFLIMLIDLGCFSYSVMFSFFFIEYLFSDYFLDVRYCDRLVYFVQFQSSVVKYVTLIVFLFY